MMTRYEQLKEEFESSMINLVEQAETLMYIAREEDNEGAAYYNGYASGVCDLYRIILADYERWVLER